MRRMTSKRPNILLWVAGFFAVVAGVTCALGLSSYAGGGRWPNGDSWVGVAELFVTAAGLLFAGVELSRTLEAVRKDRIGFGFVASTGIVEQGRDAELYLARFPDPREERVREWEWVVQFKVYLTVRGDNPATRFVGVVSPPAWDNPKVREEGSTWTRMEVTSPESSVLGIIWREEKDASGFPVWRGFSSQDFVLLPQDEFYAGTFRVKVIAHLEEATARRATPPDVVLRAYTDASKPTEVRIRLVLDGQKAGVTWVRDSGKEEA